MRPEVEAVLEDVDAFNTLMDTLVTARKERYTLEEVAHRMGYSDPVLVTDIEAEDCDPTVEELQRYARAIGHRIVFTVERANV